MLGKVSLRAFFNQWAQNVLRAQRRRTCDASGWCAATQCGQRRAMPGAEQNVTAEERERIVCALALLRSIYEGDAASVHGAVGARLGEWVYISSVFAPTTAGTCSPLEDWKTVMRD